MLKLSTNKKIVKISSNTVYTTINKTLVARNSIKGIMIITLGKDGLYRSCSSSMRNGDRIIMCEVVKKAALDDMFT